MGIKAGKLTEEEREDLRLLRTMKAEIINEMLVCLPSLKTWELIRIIIRPSANKDVKKLPKAIKL